MFDKMIAMVDAIGNGSSLEIPRHCGRQTQRSNIPAETPKEYFRLAIYIPYLDSLLQQFNMRYADLAKQVIRGPYLIPSYATVNPDELLHYYRADMPSPDTIHQELSLWITMWNNTKSNIPDILSGTLANNQVCHMMFPNILKIIHLLLLTSVTSADVERANSAFVKNTFQSSMGEDRFNALVLMYVHKDIGLDLDKIIDILARWHPRRMILFNPSC